MKWVYIVYLLVVYIGFYVGISSTEIIADKLYAYAGAKGGMANGAWTTNLNLARNDQSFFQRAIVARIGLGANTKEEAIYLNASTDSNGDELTTSNSYEVIFPEEPPVNAFWSLTVYGSDYYLVDNPWDKYTIASYHPLAKSANGQIVIYLSTSQSEDESNWIPLPDSTQNFSLTLRCYSPSDNMLSNFSSVQFPEIRPYKP